MISSGFGHVLILSESNKLFSFGRNDCSQLGFESENPDEVDVRVITQIPWDVIDLGHIKSIHCGSLHSIIFTHNNKLYSCGSNSFGQCGIPNSDSECISRFTLVEMDQLLRSKIVNVFSKFAHSGFVTSNGELFCCGRNHDGELGIPNIERVNKFTKIDHIPAIKLVDFAWKYIVIITENNEIFSSRHGILKTEPTLNPYIGKYNGWNTNNKIISVQCGNESSVLLTSSMELFGFGYSLHGEIGTSKRKIYKEIIRIGKSIPDRVCNFVTSYNQLIVFTTSGSLYVSGLNSQNQLNFDTYISDTSQESVSIKELTQVFQTKFFNSACIGFQFTILFHQQHHQHKTEKLFKEYLLYKSFALQDLIILTGC